MNTTSEMNNTHKKWIVAAKNMAAVIKHQIQLSGIIAM